jgi:PAS domain S-box-containing protein
MSGGNRLREIAQDADLHTFREAVESTGHAIYWTDTTGTIEYVNPAFEAQTGYTADEAIGQNARLLQSGVHDDTFYETLWDTILNGDVWEGEIINERKDGTRYTVKQTISPIMDESGEIVRFVAINEDITDLRETQDQLERERHRLASLLNAVPTPLVLVAFEDNEPIIQRVNNAFEETFGTTERQLLGSSLDEHIVTSPESHQARDINQTLQRGETVRREVIRETAVGTTRTFLLEAAPVDQDGTEILGTYIDITDRKRAEAKQQLLREVSQSIGEADTFTDGLERALQVICAYTEWSYGEVWKPVSNADSLEFVCGYTCTSDGAFDSFIEASETVTFEPGEGLPGRVFKSGTTEWISDVAQESADVFYRTDLAADVGFQAAFGIPLVSNDGTVVAVLTFFLQERRDIDGGLVGDVSDVVASLDGLVARRQYEKQLEEQRDNLKTLNQVVRHDIRNDLQLVQAYAELAEEHINEEGQEYLATVQESAASAVELTRTARELSDLLLQIDVETQQIMPAHPLEQEISEIQSMHSDAVITVDGSLPRTQVIGNELLGSVFRNLLQNAILHNDKDIPEVSITATTSEEMVEVRIADNGPGVPDAQKETIFGKGEKGLDSAGTGIGLYLVRSLVESYSGNVWVEDNEPEGAVFVVQLPVAE